jgi:uncharacterized protein YbcI
VDTIATEQEVTQSVGAMEGRISTEIVQQLKEQSGRGPTQCRTYFAEELVIVLLRGGYNRMEDSLFEDGKWLDVRASRQTFQDTMEGRFTEVIERLTGREVAAFMSASHQDPDLQIEAFVLTAQSADGSPGPSGLSSPPAGG